MSSFSSLSTLFNRGIFFKDSLPAAVPPVNSKDRKCIYTSGKSQFRVPCPKLKKLKATILLPSQKGEITNG